MHYARLHVTLQSCGVMPVFYAPTGYRDGALCPNRKAARQRSSPMWPLPLRLPEDVPGLIVASGRRSPGRIVLEGLLDHVLVLHRRGLRTGCGERGLCDGMAPDLMQHLGSMLAGVGMQFSDFLDREHKVCLALTHCVISGESQQTQELVADSGQLVGTHP